jgi:hypothetical protein
VPNPWSGDGGIAVIGILTLAVTFAVVALINRIVGLAGARLRNT